MMILAIDVAYRRTGWAVILGKDIIDTGIIDASERDGYFHNLIRLGIVITDICARYHPDLAVLEHPGGWVRGSFRTTQITIERMAGARAAFGIYLALSGVKTAEITTNAVKLALTGDGNATKEQVALALAQTGIWHGAAGDISDAVAIGVVAQKLYNEGRLKIDKGAATRSNTEKGTGKTKRSISATAKKDKENMGKRNPATPSEHGTEPAV